MKQQKQPGISSEAEGDEPRLHRGGATPLPAAPPTRAAAPQLHGALTGGAQTAEARESGREAESGRRSQAWLGKRQHESLPDPKRLHDPVADCRWG